MPKIRNRRSDSNTAAVKASQNAALGARKPLAHAPVPPEAMPFWEAIMHNRARDRWNDADLANAATLARLQCSVSKLQSDLACERDVSDDGWKINPKHLLMEKQMRLVMSLSRMLHVHPEATEGRSRDAGNALALEQKAVAASANIHRLIPRVV